MRAHKGLNQQEWREGDDVQAWVLLSAEKKIQQIWDRWKLYGSLWIKSMGKLTEKTVKWDSGPSCLVRVDTCYLEWKWKLGFSWKSGI